MPDDASLEDFLDADDQEAEPDDDRETATSGVSAPDAVESVDGADSPDGESDATESDDEAVPAVDDEATEQPTDPAVATYDWTPGGAACAACGETAERRWRDEPGFVCEDCKKW